MGDNTRRESGTSKTSPREDSDERSGGSVGRNKEQYERRQRIRERGMTREDIASLPMGNRIKWEEEEDKALMEGWRKHGNKWEKIWKEYGTGGNGKLGRHKKYNLRYRVQVLQERERPKEERRRERERKRREAEERMTEEERKGIEDAKRRRKEEEKRERERAKRLIRSIRGIYIRERRRREDEGWESEDEEEN